MKRVHSDDERMQNGKKIHLKRREKRRNGIVIVHDILAERDELFFASSQMKEENG